MTFFDTFARRESGMKNLLGRCSEFDGIIRIFER